MPFFEPFYGSNDIVELDDYHYALVVGPDRDYMWILSHSPQLDPGIMSTLVSKAAALRFPADEHIYVDHLTSE